MRDLPVIDDPWIGNVLDDRFDVLGLLGKGGMGAVYRCRERTSGLQVAVKLILEDWATEEEVQARFEREISASVGLRHPNIIQLLGHGQTVEGTRYFAMELVDGVSLLEHIENEGPLSSEAIAHLGAQVARGLQAAHDAGVVHRDLKPENILIDNAAQAKILDFGLALLQRGSSTPDRLTQLGVRIGSPLYMSPEYCAYGQLDHRSDLYSLGAILYEMATGRPLFSGGAYEVFAQHANSPITPIEERVPGQHPKWLRDAIESLLVKEPDERLQTAAEAAERLTRPPDLSTPVRSITPLAAGTRSAVPAPAPASVIPRPKRVPLRRILPALLLLGAAVWHGLMVGTSVGNVKARPTTTVLSHQIAWQVAANGENAYDPTALNQQGRAQRVGSPVYRSFAPPPWLAFMGWTSWFDHDTAWGIFLGLQEALLVATLLLCWQWWRPLGLAPPMAMAIAAAAMTGTALAVDQGWPVLVVLFLWIGALSRPEHWLGGLCLGLAVCIAPRTIILIPLWLFRRQYQGLLIGFGTALAASLAGLGALGVATTAAWWTEVLPRSLLGDFSGLGLRVDVFANHAPAHRLALLFPGESGLVMSHTAALLTWAVGATGLAVLSIRYAQNDDPWARISTDCLWLLGALLLPMFGTEHQLPWALPAMGLVIGGLWTGRLPGSWTVPVGVGIAVLLYPLVPLRQLYQIILMPDAPWLGPLARELKLAALVVLAAALVRMIPSRNSMQ